jgi:hypothetical protein
MTIGVAEVGGRATVEGVRGGTRNRRTSLLGDCGDGVDLILRPEPARVAARGAGRSVATAGVPYSPVHGGSGALIDECFDEIGELGYRASGVELNGCSVA